MACIVSYLITMPEGTNEELMGGGRSRGLLIVSRNMRLSNNDFVSAQLVIDLDMHPFVSIFLQENKT